MAKSTTGSKRDSSGSSARGGTRAGEKRFKRDDDELTQLRHQLTEAQLTIARLEGVVQGLRGVGKPVTASAPAEAAQWGLETAPTRDNDLQVWITGPSETTTTLRMALGDFEREVEIVERRADGLTGLIPLSRLKPPGSWVVVLTYQNEAHEIGAVDIGSPD